MKRTSKPGFFDTRPGDFWRNGINKLVERWEEVVNNNGEYIIDLKKKSVTDTHQMLYSAYRINAPSLRTCQEWFKRFKSGDFYVNDKEHEKPPKKFKYDKLKTLLDEDDAQTQ
ncbi:hypothetical protein LAZ67_11002652 [Cordylochernes scorpioides]|uniref:Mos1 transposase HTH domain-containing protein n=1 Tax=Cordylochernes scorpioides TaxID=51811 RepID=A0ABY6KZF4_9ARAC|nr:hypothetical protein LAZ67_11002652 [Cordylochernes scorpioides]